MQGKSKKILGYAGEYFVAARLSFMGYLVALTPKGAPQIDLLVYDGEKNRATAIQVKTITQEWVLLTQATKDTLDKKLIEKVKNPFVIVHSSNDWRKSEFYIVPPKDLRNLAKKAYLSWLEKAKHKKPREKIEKSQQPLMVSITDLKPYIEKWENIWIT